MAYRPQFTKRDMQIGIPILVVFLLVGGLVWWYERARSADAVVASEASRWQASLDRYYRSHGVYPSIESESPLVLSGVCLVPEGFVGLGSEVCAEAGNSRYNYTVLSPDARRLVEYVSLNADGVSVCTNVSGCPNYALRFSQTTGMLGLGGGERVFTPDGLR